MKFIIISFIGIYIIIIIIIIIHHYFFYTEY